MRTVASASDSDCRPCQLNRQVAGWAISWLIAHAVWRPNSLITQRPATTTITQCTLRVWRAGCPGLPARGVCTPNPSKIFLLPTQKPRESIQPLLQTRRTHRSAPRALPLLFGRRREIAADSSPAKAPVTKPQRGRFLCVSARGHHRPSQRARFGSDGHLKVRSRCMPDSQPSAPPNLLPSINFSYGTGHHPAPLNRAPESNSRPRATAEIPIPPFPAAEQSAG